MSVVIRSRTGPCSGAATASDGYPWQDGDLLDAADLNAAFAAAYDAAAAASDAASHNVGRNKLHNPLFNVAQRGAGGFNAVTTGWTYGFDRWELIIGAAGDSHNHTLSAITDAQRAQIGDDAAANSLAANFTGGAGAANCCISAQPVERVRRLAGKTVTISFYALAAAASPKLGVSLDQIFGTGGSPSAGVTVTGQSVTISSTTWARYSVTLAVPSISGKTLGTTGNDYSLLLFWHSAGANNATRSGNVGVQSGTHLIWGVQCEIGTVATPLEKPDPQQDLATCQRFYQTGQVAIYNYAAAAGANTIATVTLPVTMRATPTLLTLPATLTNLTAGSSASISAGAVQFGGAAVAIGQTVVSGSFTVSADL